MALLRQLQFVDGRAHAVHPSVVFFFVVDLFSFSSDNISSFGLITA